MAASLVGIVTSAFAGEPTAAEREAAKQAYADARTLTKEGKLAEALEKFRRAHELAPTPVTRLDFARALAGQGQLVEARGLAASTPSMPITATETQKSKDARRDATKLVTELDTRIPTVTLTWPAGSTPDETEVAVDGLPLSKELLGRPLPLDPGEHTVATRLGERTASHVERFAEGERKTLTIPMPPPIVTPPVTPVAPVSEAPPVEPIRPRAAEPRVATTPREEEGVHPFVPVMFTIAGVSLLTGTVTGAIALSQVSELESGCPGGVCPTALHDELSLHRGLGTTATVGFVVGGVAAAAGAVGWIIDASAGDDTRAATRLRVSGTGLAVEGTW